MKASVWVDVVVTTRVLVEVSSNPEDVRYEAELAAKNLVAEALDHDDVSVIANACEPDWADDDDHDAACDEARGR